MRTPKYLKNNTLELNEEKCIGCGRCLEVCPHAVFIKNDNRVRIENKNNCMECGACSMNCPADAVHVNAGVGCAAALIYGALTGAEPVCGCSADGSKGSGCC